MSTLLTAAYSASALAVLAAAGAGIKSLRARSYWRKISDAYQPLPPDAPQPLWLLDFYEFCQIADHLNPHQQQHLDRIYIATTSNQLERLADHTLEFARHIHRLDGPLNTELELASLENRMTGAWMAALAILTRDAIDQKVFAQLTTAWLTAGLPLPGGDTCAAYTLLVERCAEEVTKIASTAGHEGFAETAHLRWEPCSGPEICHADKAASAQQAAESVAVTLAASADPHLRLWRVSVWNGAITDMSVLRTTPPDGCMIVANVRQFAGVVA